MPEFSTQAIDLAYRPETYFWAYDNRITLSSDIKGSRRKALYERAILNGDVEFANTLIAEPTLTSEARRFQGGFHPSWMGGEYLPDRENQEVEIARITIASTTQDVTCIYAKRGATRIYYRVVDEYDGMTLDESTRSSIQPLTLNEVVTFFFKGWDILCCLEANFADHGYPKEEVQGFILDASSSFYAEFGLLVRQRVDLWLDQKRADRYSDDLLDGEDDDE